MDRFEKIFLILSVSLIVSFSVAVVNTASEIQEILERNITETRETEADQLLKECSAYYNDGTDRWMECMGVGYK